LLGVDDGPAVVGLEGVEVGVALRFVGVAFKRRIFLLMWLELVLRREKSRISCFWAVCEARYEERRIRVGKCLRRGGVWVWVCVCEEGGLGWIWVCGVVVLVGRFDGVLGVLSINGSS
jgi:hypothetical protein